ncbi:MAG: invasin domain 3-containing protein, partial [Flavobacterium sp.]
MKKSLFFLIFFFNLSVLSGWSQTTHDFTANATLSYGSGGSGIWNTQADITVGGVAYKLTCGGNGSFTNSTSGGVINGKCLKKDGSGGDQFTLQRTDGQPFQFYGMWVKHQSMNSYSSFYTLPPWYTLNASGEEDQNGFSQTMYTYQDMTAMSPGATSLTTGTSTINSGTGGVTVTSVQISFQAIIYFWIDNIIVGPAVSNNTAPVVTTASAATITTASAVLGGNVTSDGGASVSERGVVYSSNLNPTISDSKLIIGSGLGTFSNTLSSLPDATTYHYRAYARNSIGTGYGSDATFTTATVNNPCDVNRKYDKIVSGYHSSIALSGNGEFLVWGQNIASNGTASVAPPVSITGTNFSGVSGTVLFTSLGGIGSGGEDQFVALSTGGLYAWGKPGAILNTALKSSAPFGLITTPIGGDTTTKLPIGVAPTDVTMLFAMYQTLAIVANGNVWVLVNTDANLQGDGTSLAATTWHKVKVSASVDLTNVIAVRGQVSKTTGQSAMMAITSVGEAYTWGSTTYLGNNTASTSKNYATLMTLPSEFNSSNKPKTIGVTGSSQTAIPNTLYVLSYSGSLYALGNNSYKQCGDFTSTERKSWVNVKSSSTTNFSNIAFFSTQEHTAKMAGVAAITFTGDLYSWGDNDGFMIGRSTETIFDPGIPTGFTVGSDKAIFTELGGHTLVYVKEGSDRFCYVGHRTQGSMGESTTSSGDVTTFDCSNTPVISLCGAVPIAANVNNSTINVSTASIPADGTTTSTITIQLKDSSNNNLTTTGGNVQVFTTAGTLGLITDNNNGTYTLTLTSSQLSEVATITFSVNGVSSSNSTSVSFVLPNLILTSFTPTTGTSGTQVSITGQNFTGVNSVKFNNVEATAFTVNSATSITATAPVNVQTGVIKVTANSQSHQGQSIVDSFSNASCTTGWSNAWQTITNDTNNNAITAVRINLDNASVNTYGLYLELHNADLNSASANPSVKFNQTTLIGTSSTTNVAQQGMGMVQFNFANTILLSPSTNYYIVIKEASGNPAGTGQQRITFSCSNTDGGAGNNFGTLEFELETSPVFRVSTAITINSSSLTSFSSCLGAASSQQTVTVSGVGLTNDVVVTAPTDFEVSLTTGSGFGSSVTIVASGTLSATTVYLRLAASATGTPSGNLTIATQGLTTQNIAISGTITTVAAAASSQTNLACNGGTTGTATVTVSGGTTPYTYSWSPSGGTSATASGLSAGVYTCTVTDANGCSATRSFTLTQPVVLAAAASSQTNLACNGGTTG